MDTSQFCSLCKSGRIYCHCYTCISPAKTSSVSLEFYNRVPLCQPCDSKLHGTLKQGIESASHESDHIRGLLCSECEAEDAFGYCEDCEQYMCQTCSKLIHNKGARLRHVLDKIKLSALGFVNNALEIVEARQTSSHSNLPPNQIQTSVHEPTLAQIFPSATNNQIIASVSAMKPILTQQPEAQKPAGGGITSQTRVPMYQPLLIDPGDSYLTMLMALFREQAALGNLMIGFYHIVKIIEQQLGVTSQAAKDLILRAEKKSYIIVTVRSFGSVKTLVLVSMRLQFVSCECVQWVLRSLKRDGMCPNERAVQSRIKEAFGVKLSSQLWDDTVASLESIQESAHLLQNQIDLANAEVLPLRNSRDFPKVEYRYLPEATLQNGKAKQIKYSVRPIEKVEELEGQAQSWHLYLQGERYKGYDQDFGGPQFNPSDPQSEIEITNDKIIFHEFKRFMEEYFLTTQHDNFDFNQRDNEEQDQVLQTLKKNSLQAKGTKNSAGSKRSAGPLDKPPLYQGASTSQNFSGSSDSFSKQHQNSSLGEFNEDGKAIPGGRYGCAQFVKLCGPQILKDQSLGKLAQLVQRCINDDFLRYQRTLLVLTHCIDKTKLAVSSNVLNESTEEDFMRNLQKKAEIGAKLKAVKQSIIEVLAEHKQGVSLPQLPIYLKRKLPFKLDWNQLGFAKLKDLIISMNDQIKLDLIGPNHTLAYLIYSGRYHHTNGAHSDDLQNIPRFKPLISDYKKLSVDYQATKDHYQHNLMVSDSDTLEQVLTLFYQMLKEFPMGIESNKIGGWLSQNLGQPFDFRHYGCNSIYEFINKFIMPTTEITIINNKPDSFLIRSKQIYSSTQTSASVESGSYKRKNENSSDGGNNSFNRSSSQGSSGGRGASSNNQHSSGRKGQKKNEKARGGGGQELKAGGGYGEESGVYGQSVHQNGENQYQQMGVPSQKQNQAYTDKYYPCALSYYGQQQDDSQLQTQINISHMRNNTEDEIASSQNTTQIHHPQTNQQILPQSLYHHPTQEQWHPQPQEWQTRGSSGRAPYQQSYYPNAKSQSSQQPPPGFNHPPASRLGQEGVPGGNMHLMMLPESNPNLSLGSSIDYISYSTGHKNNQSQINNGPQLNPYPIFEKFDSAANSPKHNRAVSYLFNQNSISSLQDLQAITSQMTNQPGSNKFGGQKGVAQSTDHQIQEQPSKESSLEEERNNQRNAKEPIKQNEVENQDRQVDFSQSMMDQNEIFQSNIHSRLIEDLLSDTETDQYERKTTGVHTPQLSMSSFYKQLPPSQGSSLNPTMNTQMSFLSGGGPYSHLQYSLPSKQFDQSIDTDESSIIQLQNMKIQVAHVNVGQVPAYQQMQPKPSFSNYPTSYMPTSYMPHQVQISQPYYPQQQQTQQQPQGNPQNLLQQQQQQQQTPHHDQAQLMHSRAASQDYSQFSLFGNQLFFNPPQPPQYPVQQLPAPQAPPVQQYAPLSYNQPPQIPKQTSLQQESSYQHPQPQHQPSLIPKLLPQQSRLQQPVRPIHNNYFASSQQHPSAAASGSESHREQQATDHMLHQAKIHVEYKPAGPPSASFYHGGTQQAKPSQQQTPSQYSRYKGIGSAANTNGLAGRQDMNTVATNAQRGKGAFTAMNPNQQASSNNTRQAKVFQSKKF